jgi:hypothetical protein
MTKKQLIQTLYDAIDTLIKVQESGQTSQVFDSAIMILRRKIEFIERVAV